MSEPPTSSNIPEKATAVLALPPPSPLAKWTQLLIVTSTLLLLILLVALVIRLGMAIQHTVLLFALGGLIAYALDPLVEWLRFPFPRGENTAQGLSRGASIALLFGILLLVSGLSIWWLGGRIVDEVAILQRDYPEYQDRAMAMAQTFDQSAVAQVFHLHLVDMLKDPPPELRATVAHLGGELLPFFRNVVAVIAESVIVLLIAVYFLVYGSGMRREFNHLLPARILQYVEPWQTDVSRILGGFVRGQLAIALITGAVAGIACFGIGIHLWLLMGTFAVGASLIPVFGPYIGALPAIIAALVGPTHFSNPVVAAVVVAVCFGVINEIASKVLYPRLVGAALGLHEVLVLFVLFAGLELDGIMGTLFAAPVTALVIVTVVHLYRFWQDLPDDLLSKADRKPPSAPPVTH